MATVREEIQAKIDAIKAKAAADVAELEAHLAVGGDWIDKEFTAAKEWLEGVVAKVREEL
jgi:hypothetical protein